MNASIHTNEPKNALSPRAVSLGAASLTSSRRRGLPALAAAVALALVQAATAAPPVEVVSGGVGLDDYAALNQQAGAFSLKIVTATRRSGAWLSDVDVTVRSLDRGDVLIEHMMQGPLMLARLPAGRYEITATADNPARADLPVTVKRQVRIGHGLTQAVLYFDVHDVDAAAVLSTLERIDQLARR